MTALHALASALALSALVVACDPPTDLGQVCVLHNGANDGGIYTTVSNQDDFYDNGTPECQNLVCLRPAGSSLDAGLGFCSSPCTPQNGNDPNSHSDDCNGSVFPLVCRQASLDQAFLDMIAMEPNGKQLLEEFLGGTTAATLCTTPTGYDGGA